MTKQTNLPTNSHITLDALLCACSIYNIHRGVLGTTVNPDTCPIRVDGRIRFEYATCGREFFLNPQQKICRIQKYPDTCGRGLSNIYSFKFKAICSFKETIFIQQRCVRGHSRNIYSKIVPSHFMIIISFTITIS